MLLSGTLLWSWVRGSTLLVEGGVGPYPNIRQVMFKYVSVPASSVPSERVFSSAGEVLKGREALDPDNANLLIFLYQNLKKYKNEVLPEWSAFVD